MNKFCDSCQEETNEITHDDSFTFPGVKGDQVQQDSHEGSDCCDDKCEDGIWIICKCGNEIEIHPEAELHEIPCKLCQRTGKWEKNY